MDRKVSVWLSDAEYDELQGVVSRRRAELAERAPGARMSLNGYLRDLLQHHLAELREPAPAPAPAPAPRSKR